MSELKPGRSKIILSRLCKTTCFIKSEKKIYCGFKKTQFSSVIARCEMYALLLGEGRGPTLSKSTCRLSYIETHLKHKTQQCAGTGLIRKAKYS